jgi:hypothetical protein
MTVRVDADKKVAVKNAGVPLKLALFDLDHTLIPIDSDYEWGEFTIALGWCDATEFKRRNAEFFEQYRAGTLDIHDYVRFATQAIREQGTLNSIAAHARFMSEIVHKAIKNQALELVGRHRAAGDELVIVTATNEFVTRPIADAFGVASQSVEVEPKPLGATGLPVPARHADALSIEVEGIAVRQQLDQHRAAGAVVEGLAEQRRAQVRHLGREDRVAAAFDQLGTH